jgi:hypothetical protein
MKGRSRDTLQRPLCDARPEQRIRSIVAMIADELKAQRVEAGMPNQEAL